MASNIRPVREVMLTRKGLVYISAGDDRCAGAHLQAVELELAQLGYCISERLRARIASHSVSEVTDLLGWLTRVLAAHSGATEKHEPLFRNFPDGIPGDTLDLWIRKVLSHFLQAEDQPCLFCRRTGTTHVLSCMHVVCDHCFDGASYSACPVCEHHVDRSSPFFEPNVSQGRGLPEEKVKFKLLDYGEDLSGDALRLFEAFCARKQALNPTDQDDLRSILIELGEHVLQRLPEEIPLKENIAIVFGSLFRACPPDAVMASAFRYMSTATDVLRFIAAFSGASPALQKEYVRKVVPASSPSGGWWGKLAAILGSRQDARTTIPVTVSIGVNRFKVGPMKRAHRRAILAFLEKLDEEALITDMLRHRSYWVWMGEFLHPHEYADRFPRVARAFWTVRRKDPQGNPAPEFRGYVSKLEHLLSSRDSGGVVQLLAQRPGDFARRLDHALRVLNSDRVTGAFLPCIPRVSTPVLLTLLGHLPARAQPARVRVYFPKGPVTTGVSSSDQRPAIPSPVSAPIVRAIEAELLRRFAERGRLGDCIIDAALAEVLVPFNERTASRSAVNLPRGSRIRAPDGKVLRLFLHWCEPPQGRTTDLDLSVGFYTDRWAPAGVCSFYQLKHPPKGEQPIATSAGDLRSAPFPDGATEFVDVHRDRALKAGIRYAVMVVNSYAGMSFAELERGYAGLMLRDDTGGKHFDPRTVALRFALDGDNGVFMPLVLDVQNRILHWLDVYAKGGLACNTVASSKVSITKVCPDLMDYFQSGVRLSMLQLAELHAAARARRVFLRDGGVTMFERGPAEDAAEFLDRLRRRAGGTPASITAASQPPVCAVLFTGDLDPGAQSQCYALFRETVTPNLSASDLIS